MKTEITFKQVAHHYLRSELKCYWDGVSGYWNLEKIIDHLVKSDNQFTPIFTPFENLIKQTKANKYVAELLGINEGDEYVMANHLIRYMTNDMSFTIENKQSGGYLINWDDGNTWGLLIDDEFQTGIVCVSNWQALLIAAGYNVFQIKDCKYE